MNSPLLCPQQHATAFCGGILSPQRLNHPEGLCVDPADGSIWCGGTAGELYHVSPDGKKISVVAQTGGFILGICLDSRGRLYLCDLHHKCVVVVDRSGREITRLEGRDAEEQLLLPNYAVLSRDEHFLYVSDTRRKGGPGIWRFDLKTGENELWMNENCLSANGLALAPDGRAIYMVESHLPGVCVVPILPDGSAGSKRVVFSLPSDEPDGLAFDNQGKLWISIYNPSRIYRYDLAANLLQIVMEDLTTDWLHHPTNLAFRGNTELFSTNFGAWHLTRIDLSKLADDL